MEKHILRGFEGSSGSIELHVVIGEQFTVEIKLCALTYRCCVSFCQSLNAYFSFFSPHESAHILTFLYLSILLTQVNDYDSQFIIQPKLSKFKMKHFQFYTVVP